jgi:shikimate kinase
MRMIVFLLGFMGSGKSYWSERLAAATGAWRIDLDELIEQAEGMSVTDLFMQKGEEYFRKREAEILRAIPARAAEHPVGQSGIQAIVACGGGTPCFHENMDWMNHAGKTVWLHPPDSELLNRLKSETEKRPLIRGLDQDSLAAFIRHKNQEREGFYKLSHCEVKNTHIAVTDFLKIILDA